MGTRHLQVAINKNGVTKISQYGQWDGYPDGQGKYILNYLRNGNLEKYQEELDNIHPISEQQIEMVDSNENWKKEYPYLSRDCGSDIHQMIEDGKVKFVHFTNIEEANKWCQGFYIIDFQKGVFTSEFGGHQSVFYLNNLPTIEEYLNEMTNNN